MTFITSQVSVLYKLGVRGYALAAQVASLFSAKAKLRVDGAKDAISNLAPTPAGTNCYWLHCASVGEFEQGRPLWDRMIAHEPHSRFVLSFFSPSGYEAFSGKSDVGEVVYLPWDVGTNASDFIGKLSPKLAIFVKYEWWLGYFEALAAKEISTVVISAAFRQNQPFFKKNVLRPAYQKALGSVDHIFVQDESSATLLKSIGESAFTVSGDTRIDRTISNKEATLNSPLLENWAKQGDYTMVAGSTWLPDVELLAVVMKNHKDLKLIIAPHEVDEKSISQTIQVLAKAVENDAITRLSKLESSDTHRIIIIDYIGLLSKLYRLGEVAYIGGGFGAGIHNTLEAAVYGVPIAFGPKHEKFQEAVALVDQKIATVVVNAKDLSTFVELYSGAVSRKVVLAKADTYIEKNQGATQRIWDYLIERKLI